MISTKVALILGATIISLLVGAHCLSSVDALAYKLRSPRGAEELKFRVGLFKEWTAKYRKLYGAHETLLRFRLWEKTYDFVQEHNAKGLSWTVGTNQFADLTDEEFSAQYLGFKWNPNKEQENVVLHDETDLPNDVDWRTKGGVTDVKNQGQCGSCWSFSASGALEGLYFVKKGTLVSLTEQQLVDCSSSYGNNACQGGLMDGAFKYTKDKGIEKESDYPYKGTNGTCKYNASKIVFKNTGYTDVKANSPDQLKAALNQQPVSVAIEADEKTFSSYTGGIISSGCGTNLDHGVLAVGYGSNYTIVKNSWGTSWGEKGYVRIASGSQNSGKGVCGINSQPSYPTL